MEEFYFKQRNPEVSETDAGTDASSGGKKKPPGSHPVWILRILRWVWSSEPDDRNVQKVSVTFNENDWTVHAGSQWNRGKALCQKEVASPLQGSSTAIGFKTSAAEKNPGPLRGQSQNG